MHLARNRHLSIEILTAIPIESSDSNTSRRPRRKVRSCFLCESSKHTVSYCPLLPSAKRHVKSHSRHASASRSDRPRQEDKSRNKAVRFEKDSRSKRSDKAYMVDSESANYAYKEPQCSPEFYDRRITISTDIETSRTSPIKPSISDFKICGQGKDPTSSSTLIGTSLNNIGQIS